MFMPIRIAVLLLAALVHSLCLAELPDRVLSLSHPGVKWLLQFDMPNALEQYNQYKEGAGAYAHGQTMDGGMRFSMVIHQYPGASDAKSCRDVELANIRKQPVFANFKIDLSESGEAAYLRISGTAQIDGRAIFGQYLHRWVFRDGLCAKVHVSSSIDDSAVSKALAQAADSMRIRDAGGAVTRSFHVPPRGALKVAMPGHWGFETSSPFGAPVRTVTIRTPDGQFQFMTTIFTATAGTKESAETATLRTAQHAREQAASKATQTQIDIQPLKGAGVEGHYIFVTDKTLVGKPAVPNNWKHMRQGMVKIGAALATFTVFSNDENAPDALQAMRALEGMAFTAE